MLSVFYACFMFLVRLDKWNIKRIIWTPVHMLEKILSKADSGDKTRIDCRYPAGSFLFKLKLELKTSIQIVTCFEYQSTTCIRNSY